VNLYVRPRRTFSTVELDREAPVGQADTDNTRRPVHTERLNWLPRPILATDLPSIRRSTTEVRPRFGSLETIRRPVDRASAIPIETAYMRVRIRTLLHVEMYFEFILTIISLGTHFWTSGSLLTRPLRVGLRFLARVYGVEIRFKATHGELLSPGCHLLVNIIGSRSLVKASQVIA